MGAPMMYRLTAVVLSIVALGMFGYSIYASDHQRWLLTAIYLMLAAIFNGVMSQGGEK